MADADVVRDIPQSVTSSLPPFLTFVLSVAGPLVFFGLQLSGLKTVSIIKETKSTGDLSPAPFFTLFVNCIFGVFYGTLTSDLTVLVPNASGALFGAYYVYVYQSYDNRPFLRKYYIVSAIFLAIPFAYTGFLERKAAATAVGLTQCGLSVAVMASPLATVFTVIRTKSTASLPFLTSLANFGNGLTWAAYGYILAHDPIIYIPNLIGMMSAVLQLTLFLVYGMPPPPSSHAYALTSSSARSKEDSSTGGLCPILMTNAVSEKQHADV